MGRTPAQRSVDAALVDVCRRRTPGLPEAPAAVEDFLLGVHYHRIAPLAHVALRQVNPSLAARLQSDRDSALINHLRMSALLGGIVQLLDGIPWLVFKGPVLSEFAHPVPGLRYYRDLDLLVAPGDFRTACHRLMEAGWHIVVSDESLESEEFPGEVPLVNPSGIVLDLHWSMLVTKTSRGRFSVEAGPLLERRTPATIGPVALSMLEPADALVHVCHHAALIGATKLGHVLDADQLARQADWDRVIARSKEWGAGPQVAVVLGRARRLFDTPVPADLGRRLGLSRAMVWALAQVDKAWPIESLRQDESWIRLVTRALRPSLARTIGAAIRRVAQGVITRVKNAGGTASRVPASPAVIETFLSRVEALGSTRSASR